jgi:hypothetical protein
VVKRAPVWHLSNGVFDHAARWACFDSAGHGGTEWRRRLLRPRPRFSPLEQRNTCQQYSPENQLEVIRQYARSRNMEIAQVYSDHGRSGLNIAGREGFNRLMSDVEQGHADALPRSHTTLAGGDGSKRCGRGRLLRIRSSETQMVRYRCGSACPYGFFSEFE